MSDKNDIVILNLDRPRMVWFGHKALKTLGSMLGKTLEEVAAMLDSVDFDSLETVMYCGLLTDAKNNNEILKLEDMEDLLDKASYTQITSALTRGLEAAFGEQEKNPQRIAANKKK